LTPSSGLLKLPGLYGGTREALISSRPRDGKVGEVIKARFKHLGFATFGFLILLVALFPSHPVVAQAPGLGHAFSGTVKVDGEDAAIGTVINAQVDGIGCGSCTITNPGFYGLIVQDDITEGTTIHFYVSGQEADQTFVFHDGWTSTLNLTAPAPPVLYDLNISSTEGGSITGPGVGNFTYGVGTIVDLLATPDAGYRFVQWTGNVGTISNVYAAATTITMQDDYSITANFEETSSPFPFPFPFPFPLPCFIATAAYGTPTAEQIDVLREFRDVVLLKSTVGSRFVGLYYWLSPPIADFIAGNDLLRTLVRNFLIDPVVWMVEATADIWRN